jgi:phosphotransferase system enzyme I (PtsP)
MAHGPRYIPFLLGIGVRSLSVDPAYLLRTQQIVGRTSLSDAKELAQSALAQSRVSDIAALLDTASAPEATE